MTVRKDYSKINDKFDQRLEHMIDNHNKVTFFRFDVRAPKDMPHDKTNKNFKNFIKLLKEPLTRAGNEMHYVWCREQKTSEHPHYHVAALVNGSHIQQVGGIMHDANRIWQNITGCSKEGLIDHCNRLEGRKVPPQIRLDRPSSKKDGDELALQVQEFETKKETIRQRAHYLGKDDQKGDAPSRVREHGTSQLPKSRKR